MQSCGSWGTGTFLTDANGLAYEFFINLPFGETMAEQHSQTEEYANRWKFTGHELDRETGLYYANARYYDPRTSIWISVDPLAEQAPDWTPYRYGFNNPIRFIDPDGMFEYPPSEEEFANRGISIESIENGYEWRDADGNWAFNSETKTWEGIDGTDVNIYAETRQIEGIEITNQKQSEPKKKGYFESYYKDYFSYKRPAHANAYSPYIPSGFGFTGSGSLGGFSASLSLAINERNDIDLFYSFDGTFRLHNIFSKPWGVSATFDVYDNNGRTGNIFDNITGEYRTISGSMIFSGAYSYPIRNGVRDEQGVTKTSFGFGSPSAGYGGGKTWRLFGEK